MCRSLALAGLRLQPLSQLGSLSATVESLICGGAAEKRAIQTEVHTSSQHCPETASDWNFQLQRASKPRRSAFGSCVNFYSQHYVRQKATPSFAKRTFAAMATAPGPSPNPPSITIKVPPRDDSVPVNGVVGLSESDLDAAVNSVPFQQWLKALGSKSGLLTLGGNGGARVSLRSVLVQSVDHFGKRVGFVKFKAEVVDEATGKTLPGIVFARGGAVGILMLLKAEGRTWAVLTEQARVPVGRALKELPAGMLDDDEGDFSGTAAKEVEEEVGIHIKGSDLVDLTALLDESTGRRMLPSPGGSDEEIGLMLYRAKVDAKVIKDLQGKQTGLQDHGELIQLVVVPYEDLWKSTADSKALAAIALYENASRRGLLPPAPNAESQ
ncbi:Nucleoside diphosphate-sugar hydrolase of the MutT (NUDIX) family [Klebsormidium nitens]|uniref:Nucleoside diphosphate-sugar hydrolase of the MutT (NUDIX) family n=1 Tax=Klebsormidium nitens TaxID=105231 RepID=A0A1Y1HML8_KLENI|nr:Nucleoside diphosphate-sugar hydrolase of the MutT (NUDIX) family [Klebsormidium nitens]|eukprot:GAQ78439.1 Nucleoside diphosphate-sugar hydrolase of the MutT (NUDIX) family [Klebsormidium nitens]